MLNINIEKERLRKEYLKVRKNIKNKNDKSLIITNKLLEFEPYKKAKVIALYKSLSTEVNTDFIIEESLKFGKTICLPRTYNGNLNFYKIDNLNDNFEISNFKILEPLNDPSKLINSSMIDLIIVPGICFDKEKNRLGFGKGYYDKYLTNRIISVGLFFEKQKVNKVPTNEFDCKLDYIITDKNIY